MRALPRLWLCADLDHPEAPSLEARVARALTAGPAVVWLRSPQGYPARELLTRALALASLAHRAQSLLVVGDRLDVALCAGADGVHLPERGLLPEDARALLDARGRPDGIVSVAVHHGPGLSAARGHATALVVSPFGPVPGKGAPLGERGLAALRHEAPEAFLVALGGIRTPDDARRARAAGADAVAVRRALLEGDSPEAACVALQHALGEAPRA